ncbi:Uncharacterized protein FWK35_00038717 [Aphis craccivora]|uniref:Uncharacterized protein n=1 Tax=Aphis craccivora TaxID=307492 RepID=A0A6G0VRC7_APHCR|nr:Uncharacterized protein FWK35_00038717 [Aphis craccivora]
MCPLWSSSCLRHVRKTKEHPSNLRSMWKRPPSKLQRMRGTQRTSKVQKHGSLNHTYGRQETTRQQPSK